MEQIVVGKETDIIFHHLVQQSVQSTQPNPAAIPLPSKKIQPDVRESENVGSHQQFLQGMTVCHTAPRASD